MAKICTLTKTEADELELLFERWNSARAAIEQRLIEIADEWQEAFDRRSEKWRESDVGAEAYERLETLQGMLEELPEDNTPNLVSVS